MIWFAFLIVAVFIHPILPAPPAPRSNISVVVAAAGRSCASFASSSSSSSLLTPPRRRQQRQQQQQEVPSALGLGRSRPWPPRRKRHRYVAEAASVVNDDEVRNEAAGGCDGQDDDEEIRADGATLFPERLNIIYDSKCSVCRWEVDFLRLRMETMMNKTTMKKKKTTTTTTEAEERGRNGGGSTTVASDSSDPLPPIRFTDLESDDGYDDFDPRNGGVTYQDGMRTFTAVRQDGTVLRGVDVFVEAYDLVGLGWVFGPFAKEESALSSSSSSSWMRRAAKGAYEVFAKYRTDITRGANVEDLIRQYYGYHEMIRRRQQQQQGELETGKNGDDDDDDETECIACKNKSMAV